MDKKYLLMVMIVLALVVFAPFAYAADNILTPAWNNILGLWGESVDEDVVPGMFGYTLKGWEIGVCSQHVTGDLSYKVPQGFSGISTDLRKIYDTSATLQAMKRNYSTNETLIEVAWYIHPHYAAEYTLFLQKGTQKHIFFPSRTADPMQGESGYAADYYPISYEYAVLAYKGGEEILRIKIVEQN